MPTTPSANPSKLSRSFLPTSSVALLEACEPATAKLHYWSVYPTNAVSESLLVISCDEKASCGTPRYCTQMHWPPFHVVAQSYSSIQGSGVE